MISHATPEFWACYAELPDAIKVRARAAYAMWRENPRHPSLHFKSLPANGEEVFSVRIGLHWRALGIRDGDEMIWFWIGSHADYDRLIG